MASRKTSGAAVVAPEVTPDEELPFHAAVPRLAAPGDRLEHGGFPGLVLIADAAGVVRPKTPDEVRLADALGLPALRKE